MDRPREARLDQDADGVARDLLGGTDALDRSLQRWAADAVVDEAARARIRARWLRIQAEGDATFAGALLDLAERDRPVVLDVGGHRVRGVLVGVGGDFVAVRSDQAQQVLVRTDDIVAVRAEPGTGEVSGDRSARYDLTLDAVMGPIAADRPDVLVRSRDGVVVRGELRSAGIDVLALRVGGDPPTPTWVPLRAVSMLVIEP
ncbi:MAG: hypothetical protein U5K30_02535 [Acidimicrobiales bacterium]|nr:hypothetical protein [Acidimicrobiales bacterium]